jgi:hypothetical protein
MTINAAIGTLSDLWVGGQWPPRYQAKDSVRKHSVAAPLRNRKQVDSQLEVLIDPPRPSCLLLYEIRSSLGLIAVIYDHEDIYPIGEIGMITGRISNYNI